MKVHLKNQDLKKLSGYYEVEAPRSRQVHNTAGKVKETLFVRKKKKSLYDVQFTTKTSQKKIPTYLCMRVIFLDLYDEQNWDSRVSLQKCVHRCVPTLRWPDALQMMLEKCYSQDNKISWNGELKWLGHYAYTSN